MALIPTGFAQRGVGASGLRNREPLRLDLLLEPPLAVDRPIPLA
jgi:hypothetical protein